MRHRLVGGFAAAVLLVGLVGCRSSQASHQSSTVALPSGSPAVINPAVINPATPSTPPLRNPLRGVSSRSSSVPGVAVSAAVLDLRTDRSWYVNPGLSAYTASLVKVPIYLAFAHWSPPGAWSAKTRSIAAQMIEQSSNDAATTLWKRAGGAAALVSEFARLGMAHTTAAPVLLEPWDGVRTTVGDQVHLLRQVMHDTQPGSASLLELMENPDAEQSWGVGYDIPLGWQVARKDGWVPVKGTTEWTTSSIGVVTGDSVSVAIAIITSGAPTYSAGRQVVNRVARLIDRQLFVQDR